MNCSPLRRQIRSSHVTHRIGPHLLHLLLSLRKSRRYRRLRARASPHLARGYFDTGGWLKSHNEGACRDLDDPAHATEADSAGPQCSSAARCSRLLCALLTTRKQLAVLIVDRVVSRPILRDHLGRRNLRDDHLRLGGSRLGPFRTAGRRHSRRHPSHALPLHRLSHHFHPSSTIHRWFLLGARYAVRAVAFGVQQSRG